MEQRGESFIVGISSLALSDAYRSRRGDKMEKLKIEYVPIESIKPNEYNPKGMTKKEAEDLEKSIIEFDIVDPIIANKAKGREGRIIGGHQRFKIYKKIGVEEVPIIFINIPDMEKEKELCLRLSKNVGSWDWDLLANFDQEQLIEVGFEEGRYFNG